MRPTASWPAAVGVGLVTAPATAVAAVVHRFASWYARSDREGAAGYAVIFAGLAGGTAGVLLGVAAVGALPAVAAEAHRNAAGGELAGQALAEELARRLRRAGLPEVRSAVRALMTTATWRRRWCALLTLALAAGCAAPAAEIDPRFAGAEREGRAVRGTLGGRAVAVLVDGCRVYDLTSSDDTRRRTPVLSPPPYPWFTACERQAAWLDSAYVTVTLGRTAFGAGGCCATGGTYRSRDGRRWERRSGASRWTPVDEPAAVRDSAATPAEPPIEPPAADVPPVPNANPRRRARTASAAGPRR